jgi:trimeric autotransporter adhesin
MSIRYVRALPKIALMIPMLVVSALSSPSAHALDICVNSVAALKSALSLGEIQSVPYKIKIAQGTYLVDADLNTHFSAPTTIEGGYSANCSTRSVSAANTVINLGQAAQNHTTFWSQDQASPIALLAVDGMTFTNSNFSFAFAAGSFVPIFANHEGELNLSNLRFTGMPDGVGATVFTGTVHIENVQYDHLTGASTCAVFAQSFDGARVTLNHVTADLNGGSDLCLRDDGDKTQMYIMNSILWSSDGSQPIFRDVPGIPMNPNTTVAFFNDIDFGELITGIPLDDNTIHVDPKWVDPANGNYRLKTSPLSPAINTGTTQVFGGEPATDIEGHLRVIGSWPDRGAYESAFNDQSVLTVANTFDSGAGSLRQAMLDANSSPGIAHTIKFDIRGPSQLPICPAVIALNSTLPAIDSTMLIDGYSQLLSTPNTSVDSFNANLCIMIKPASGTLSTGLKVLSNAGLAVSLTLRGVGLGGFSQPLALLGGQGHVIAGNQFGGVANGVSLPGAGISAVSIGVNASGSLIVGGINPADRNVIGGAANAGVNIQATTASSPTDCQVVNNLIGLTPNGVSVLTNSVGINVSGSGCSISQNRVAGNTIANLWIQGDHNLVQQNQVGFNIQNNGFFTNTYGVLVTGFGNIIGAGANGGSITANTVRYNIAGGVVIKGDTASANSVNANRIYDNGGNSDGMDIDLVSNDGITGPTPNDDTDFDSGVNDLQNFPVPKGLVYTAAGTSNRPAALTAQLATVPGIYRVDVYFSNAINAQARRGHAETILTHATVQVPFGGRLSFSLPIFVPNQNAGGVISLTATNSSGSTSEVGPALFTDTIFADGVD